MELFQTADIKSKRDIYESIFLKISEECRLKPQSKHELKQHLLTVNCYLDDANYCCSQFASYRWRRTDKNTEFRRSSPELFLQKGVLRIFSKCTGQHRYGRVVLIQLLCNFIENALPHECYLVYLIHIFKTLFYKNNFERLPSEVCQAFNHLMSSEKLESKSYYFVAKSGKNIISTQNIRVHFH